MHAMLLLYLGKLQSSASDIFVASNLQRSWCLFAAGIILFLRGFQNLGLQVKVLSQLYLAQEGKPLADSCISFFDERMLFSIDRPGSKSPRRMVLCRKKGDLDHFDATEIQISPLGAEIVRKVKNSVAA